MRIVILTLLFANVCVADKKNVPYLGAGIALPTSARSAYENPAGLGGAKESVFDLGVLFDGDPDFQGGISTHFGKKLGLGLAIERLNEAISLTPGLGFALGSRFEVGIGATFTPGESFDENFILGLRYRMKSGFSLAFVAHDAFDFEVFTLGLAWPGKVSPELDFTFIRDNDWNIDSVLGVFSLLITPNKTFTGILRYRFQVVPDFELEDLDEIELGLHLWVSKTLAIYGHYNHPFSEYVVGVTIRF